MWTLEDFMEKYELRVLTKELFNELKARKLIWEHYKLTYAKTYAVFPPNGEKPLVVTAEVWKYFKPLWDKGIYTYSYKKAIASCKNPDKRWVNEYQDRERLAELYDENPSERQKHRVYNQTVKTTRVQWTRNERAQFRHTDKWIEFRNYMVLSRNCVCDECGRKFKNEDMEVHHLIEDVDYDNLTPSRFKVLCKSCHDKIHNYSEIRQVKPIKKVKRVKKIKKIVVGVKVTEIVVKKAKKVKKIALAKKVKKIKK